MKSRLLILAPVILLAACHASPGNQYYTLSTLPAGPGGHKSLAVGKVNIPGLLDRPQIIRRSGTNEVHVLEYSRWAEPLDSMIRRVLADDLQAAPAGTQSKKHQVIVTIDEFDADESADVVLKASWTAANAKPRTFQKNIVADGSDIDSIVAAMSRLLSELAQAIAKDA